jgi:hypothetical protein
MNTISWPRKGKRPQARRHSASDQQSQRGPGEKHFSSLIATPRVIAKILLLSVFALVTLYLIATRSVPAGLAEAEPGAALSLNSAYPPAVVAYAEQVVADEAARRVTKKRESTEQQAADLGALKKSLRAALARGPLNAAAFRLLGEIALLENDPTTAKRLMTEAAKLSIAEGPANAFMLGQYLLADNPGEALRYADILMRSKNRAVGPVAQLVARMMEAPQAKPTLVALLGAAPPWRRQVLGALASSGISNPRAPLDILVALKDTPNPPTETEVTGYINFLLQSKLYAFAYSAWLQFLPKRGFDELAYLFNGSFERQPSGVPFDWMIGRGVGIAAGVYARPDDATRSALFVSFGQVRGTFPTIRQTIVLRPGSYRFSGSMTGEMVARRGLQWRVTCVDGLSAGASHALIGRFPQWASFEFDVTIPADKCAAQTVELVHMARSPSEQLASGSIWFDDLAITRSPPAPTP